MDASFENEAHRKVTNFMLVEAGLWAGADDLNEMGRHELRIQLQSKPQPNQLLSSLSALGWPYTILLHESCTTIWLHFRTGQPC